MKKILLLGAGYANLEFLMSLNSAVLNQANFTLINDTPYHCNKVLLHDVASGYKDKDTLNDLKTIKGINFIQDKVVKIEKDKVFTENSSFDFDILLIGLGFNSDTFGIKGISEYTLKITNYENSRKIFDHVRLKIESYNKTKNENDLKFIVCGAGFTGIEFIGILSLEIQKLCIQHNVDFNLVKLYCIEAMNDILPMFKSSLVSLAKDRLKKLNVEILTSSKILEVMENCVLIENNEQKKEIYANTIVWTAGVKGNEVIAHSFFKSARNKVEINNFLMPLNLQNIFIMGDCAAFKSPDGRFYPPTAQMAIKQGRYLANEFNNILNSGMPSKEFKFIANGSICSIGSGYAIGELKFNFKVSGWIAYRLKRYVENSWQKRVANFFSRD